MVRKVTKISLIALYLNDYSKRYNLRELAVLLGKPHQTIKPHVEELVQGNILVKEARKRSHDYLLNLQDRRTFEYLVIAEKEVLIEKLKQEKYLKALYEKLSSLFKHNTFIIFGSAVENVKKGSDIDLLVIGKKDVKKIVQEFEEVYNKKIHAVQVSAMNKLIMTLTKEIYKKHIIFNNVEDVLEYFGELYEKNRLV